MCGPSSERPASDKNHAPESQPEFSPLSQILPQLRDLAARLDPPHAATFATMPLARWRDGADAAARLLLEARIDRLRLQAGRGDRRTFPPTLLASLNVTSDIDLVVGMCVLVLASDHLDDEPRNGG